MKPTDPSQNEITVTIPTDTSNHYQSVVQLYETLRNAVPGNMVNIASLIERCELTLISTGLYSMEDKGRLICYEYIEELKDYGLTSEDESLSEFIKNLYSNGAV